MTLIAPILIGWLAGYLVNYLADVLPSTRRFSQPACPQCNTSLTWKDYLLFQPCQNGHIRKARMWIVQVAMTAISALYLDQTAVKNRIYTWPCSDHLLWRYLCNRHGTPPDPSPNQHLRFFSWIWNWLVKMGIFTHPFRWTGRPAHHAGFLLFWCTFYSYTDKTPACTRHRSRR